VLRPEGKPAHQVLLLHGEVEGVYPPEISGTNWGGVVIRPEEMHPSDWSYVALGHYHVQHQVADRVWYAGALDYVTSNPWRERRDEERRGAAKGWLLVDVAAGTVTRQPVTLARQVHDLPPLYGDAVTAGDLDRLIQDRLQSIPGGWADQIVRQVVFNVSRQVTRELDHSAIRAVKAAALHFHLDLRRPESDSAIGVGPAGRRQPLHEVLRDYLTRRPLPAELDRERFVQAGVALLAAVAQEEDG